MCPRRPSQDLAGTSSLGAFPSLRLSEVLQRELGRVRRVLRRLHRRALRHPRRRCPETSTSQPVFLQRPPWRSAARCSTSALVRWTPSRSTTGMTSIARRPAFTWAVLGSSQDTSETDDPSWKLVPAVMCAANQCGCERQPKLMSGLMMPSSLLVIIAKARSTSSKPKRWVVIGVGSTRRVCISRSRRPIRSLPPGHNPV
jgi:hypothetical protein